MSRPKLTPLDELLAERIRTARRAHPARPSMRWVAQQIGMHITSLHALETGKAKITIERLIQIACVLNMRPIDIVPELGSKWVKVGE